MLGAGLPVYLRGPLTDGKRKSVEPMAARLGEDGNRQTLANFITTGPWDPAHVRAALAWRGEPVIRPKALRHRHHHRHHDLPRRTHRGPVRPR